MQIYPLYIYILVRKVFLKDPVKFAKILGKGPSGSLIIWNFLDC